MQKLVQRIKAIAVCVALFVVVGYASNGLMLRRVTEASYDVYADENGRLRAVAEKWPSDDERRAYIEDKYWMGPYMRVRYSAAIPYVITAHYYFESPFDHNYLGGHGFDEAFVGFIAPLKRWRYRSYTH